MSLLSQISSWVEERRVPCPCPLLAISWFRKSHLLTWAVIRIGLSISKDYDVFNILITHIVPSMAIVMPQEHILSSLFTKEYVILDWVSDRIHCAIIA